MKKAITFIIVIIVLSMFLTIHTYADNTHQEYTTVIVKNGDTLWDIAKEINKTHKQDVRKIVYVLKKVNELDDSTIYPGQKLKVPLYID